MRTHNYPRIEELNRLRAVCFDLVTRWPQNIVFYYGDIWRNADAMQALASSLENEPTADGLVQASADLKAALVKREFISLLSGPISRVYVRRVRTKYAGFRAAVKRFARAVMEPETAARVLDHI